VLLLRHFRAYLAEQRRREDSEREKTAPSVAARSALARSGASQGQGSMAGTGTGTNQALPPSSEVRDSLGWLLYVKKWMRTKHALLFRLSSHVVQVLFTDRTSVVLASESGAMTYVGKDGAVSAHLLGEGLYAERDDIARRLRYTRDLLSQLIQRAGRRQDDDTGGGGGGGGGAGLAGSAGAGSGGGSRTPALALGLMGSRSRSSASGGLGGSVGSSATRGSSTTRGSRLPRDSDAEAGTGGGRGAGYEGGF